MTMKPVIILLAVLALFASRASANPFFSEWDTPFAVPPFDKIKLEHYQPAFDEGMRLHEKEIAAIIENTDAPTFANTIEAMDRGGDMLDRVSHVFFSMRSSMTSEELEAIAKDVVPKLSQHQDEILLDDGLFQRVQAVYQQRERLDLTPEQQKLLEEYHKSFVRGGAKLPEDKKERLKQINVQLSLLSLKFGENVLKENNRFEMVVEEQSDLAGLPPGVIAAAAETATERGHQGKWVFTLHKPSLIPFIQYSEKRGLREKIYTAYINRGNHDDELDNKETLAKMAALRVERAELLGYKTHAHFVLEENMAKQPENVYKLLGDLWKPALKRAKAEAAEMQKMIDREGGDFKLQSWDWWYYAERVKKAKYDLDENTLRPYFKLENVLAGVFDVAARLYGLKFEKRPDVPKYHEDVSVFEVKEANGDHVGVLYVDYFPRASKRGGAWMGDLRQQSKLDGKNIRPIIYNVGNFSKPTADKPSLLSFEEVNTLFHEFGHALHGLLSDCTYESLAGTNVARDFVELPSQIMENWATEPEVLKMYARHYRTGQPMPDDLIEKIQKSRHFNQGFATTEYLAASFLDMDWHTMTKSDPELDVFEFENASLNRIGLIPEIISRYRSPYFQHIFAGGYSSGYYSYIWAEVLDADAFQAFKEAGDLFDPATAKAFRQNILATGGTQEPMDLYKRFRGKEPSIEPLLENRGLKDQATQQAPKVTVILGNLLPSEGGPSDAKSPLESPFGIDFDPQGNMFIVELAGGRVHRLGKDGRLATIAGDGSKSYTGDGGPADEATFNGMHNLAVTPNGDVYVADSWNHCIRKIDRKTGKIETVAGTGEAGFSGDGGPATRATFNYVMCITLDPTADKLYVADLKNLRIRVIDLDTGIVSTVAGNGQRGVPEDGAEATKAPLVDPRAVTADSQGRVYVLERGGHALRVVDPNGRIRTVAGTGKRGFRDGPALAAEFGSPKHVCVDDQDRVLVADDLNGAVRRFDPATKSVTTVLGRGHSRPKVELLHPHGVCIEQGILYVVDTGNNRILRVDPIDIQKHSR